MRKPPTAATVTANYSSRRHSPSVVHFARCVVGLAAPPSAARAKALLFAATQIGSFGELVGLELSARALLTTPVIERFVLHIRPLVSPATTLTLHSHLRALAREVATPLSPAPLQVSRTRAHLPYSESEIARYLGLAQHQPSPARRARCEGLVALGAGAGLTGGDLRGVRGTDVVVRSGGMIVLVSGARARVVPVLSRYHDVLAASAAFAGHQFVVGGEDLTRHNVTNRLVSSLAGGGDLARLSTRRLRSTWLVAVAELTGLKSLMDAAGLTCSQHLGDVVALCAPPSEVASVHRLGGYGAT